MPVKVDDLSKQQRETLSTFFKMAAEMVLSVTPSQVYAAQAGALARGVSPSQASEIDRALVAATCFNLAAQGKGPFAL